MTTPTGGDVSIEFYDMTQALELKQELTEVYLASHRQYLDDPWSTPEQFWERLVTLYAPSRGFGLVAGWRERSMIGYAFGSRVGAPSTVWEMARQGMPELPIPDTMAPVYFLREFAVHPSCQGQGYGRRLHDAILRTRSEGLAHLLVRPENPAKTTYSG
jgi:GNAT superfamily N-acetyltransferase